MIFLQTTDLDRGHLREAAVPLACIADDGCDYTGIVIDKPWGFEMQVRGTKELAVTHLAMMAGCETSLHCHPNKTVMLTVQEGRVQLRHLRGLHDLKPGDCAIVEKGAFHRLCAQSNAVVLEIEFPPNKRDLVRLEDRYGRGQGYEKCE